MESSAGTQQSVAHFKLCVCGTGSVLQHACSHHHHRGSSMLLMNVSEYGQLTAIYKKIKRYIYIKNHTSFASAIRKGNNYIHCIKVVTKYVRKDYAPLSESSEVGRGIQGLQAVLQ